jgi:glycosyltransferase involved in cell wall biosynthesis
MTVGVRRREIEAKSGKRLAIAVVTDAIDPYHRGGKEIRYAGLLPRLQQAADVHVYTMHWWTEPQSSRTDQGVVYHAICPRLALYGRARRSIPQAIVFALACFRMLRVDYDAVEADHMPYLQLFTLRLVTRLRRRPLLVTWNEVWGPEYWRTYLGNVLGAIAWRLERRAMKLPDAIVAISSGTGNRLRSYLNGTIPVRDVPIGIDLQMIECAAPAALDETPDLLCVGRLLAHKRVDLFLDAFAKLPPERGLTGLVVGDGPERNRIERQLHDLGIDERVRLRTDVGDRAEVLALMKAAKVVVLPSFREGFGIVALEALSCGTPVVTTFHPDNQAAELVGRSDRGYLAEPTVDGIASAILRALENGAPRGTAVEPWIAAYDWAEVSRAYLETIDQLLVAR